VPRLRDDKIAYLSGVRAAELCGVFIGDIHWESGQWGRFVVNGKGARGSGPRPREAYLFQEGRALLWWYIEEIRGEFGDEADPVGAEQGEPSVVRPVPQSKKRNGPRSLPPS
jgi:hypothetical protein